MELLWLAIFHVEAPKVQVAIAPPGVIERVAVCDLGKQRPGVSGERVEEEAVDDDGC